ncbi:cytochrome c oxidase assembly protein subunit 15 [Pullulanibacillus pueri]|uniref:Heme A synthase n=1 Tax=Pullulanibacillus pueri TaxID=1437324 RepID=A0A8J2ZRI9_9BACL|nr:heme A synthase [Pullulanibacillus pueri]MBM7680096.1 cytochrome c oxidase assembly protein subunit 15 [Pullulanibacillus pueri]GGH74350.1 heme A synthase [Pullulanibacillus pueri]
MDRVLRILGVLTSLGMLIVVIMGAIVTNTGSELGCGHHWPLCYGQVVPDTSNKETFIEFSHRAVSALAGLLIVILSVWAWIRLTKVKGVKFLSICSVFFVVLQGLLGAAAVIWDQSSIVLALHFGISLISFASVLLLTVIIFEETKASGSIHPRTGMGMRVNQTLLIIYTYIVVYSGAFVRHTDSALGCPDFPLCTGQVIPDLYSRAGVQFGHRVLAGILALWILITFLYALIRLRHERWLFWGSLIAILSVIGQATSGVFVVLTQLNLTFLLLHSFFITCLFGILAFMTMIALRKQTK